MNAADQLREIDAILPTNEDLFSGDTRNDAWHSLRGCLTLLADVVEAAERALDELGVGGPIDSPEMEAEVRREHGYALCDLALLLARLSERLGEVGT